MREMTAMRVSFSFIYTCIYTWLLAGLLLASSPLQAQQTRTTTVLVSLGPRGFHPREVTVRPGRVSLMILSQTGRNRVAVDIRRAATSGISSLKRVDVLSGVSPKASGEVLTLTSGKYVVSVEDQPTISFQLNVEP